MTEHSGRRLERGERLCHLPDSVREDDETDEPQRDCKQIQRVGSSRTATTDTGAAAMRTRETPLLRRKQRKASLRLFYDRTSYILRSLDV